MSCIYTETLPVSIVLVKPQYIMTVDNFIGFQIQEALSIMRLVLVRLSQMKASPSTSFEFPMKMLFLVVVHNTNLNKRVSILDVREFLFMKLVESSQRPKCS